MQHRIIMLCRSVKWWKYFFDVDQFFLSGKLRGKARNVDKRYLLIDKRALSPNFMSGLIIGKKYKN